MQFTEEQQRFIIVRLAEFYRVQQIRDDLKNQFTVEVKHDSTISYYDIATNAQGKREVRAELQQLFHSTRKRFLEKEAAAVQNIGIAHLSVRLRHLDDLLDHQFVKLSPELKMKVLEQAAKERGGLYTQRITGARPQEVDALIDEILADVKRGIIKAIPDTKERERVLNSVSEEVDPEPTGSGKGLAATGEGAGA